MRCWEKCGRKESYKGLQRAPSPTRSLLKQMPMWKRFVLHSWAGMITALLELPPPPYNKKRDVFLWGEGCDPSMRRWKYSSDKGFVEYCQLLCKAYVEMKLHNRINYTAFLHIKLIRWMKSLVLLSWSSREWSAALWQKCTNIMACCTQIYWSDRKILPL